MEIFTDIIIQAKPETVWGILVDFKQYPTWNPFLTKAEGKVEKGHQIKIEVSPPGMKSMEFTPKIIQREENRELRWLGKFFLPGFFDGKHTFIIEDLDSKSIRLIHKEMYSGILIPLLAKKLENNTKKGFELMNQALKERAENQN